MFEKEVVKLGSENRSEYSLYNLKERKWLVVDDEGSINFKSDIPVSLRDFYSDEAAGGEKFAYNLLKFLKDNAGTGEVIADRVVDVDPSTIRFANAVVFINTHDKVIETGREFDYDYRCPISDVRMKDPWPDDVEFLLRGPSADVSSYLDAFEKTYPATEYETTFDEIKRIGGIKTVYVRRRLEGKRRYG